MNIIIEGAGEIGSHLAKMLRAEGNPVTVIDDNAQRLQNLSSVVDVNVIQGESTSLDVLKDAGAAKADLFIAVNPFMPQEINLIGCILAKSLGTKRTAARIKDEELLGKEGRGYLKAVGIDYVFYPERFASDEIVSALQHNSAIEMMDMAGGKMQIEVFKLDENSPLLDLRLSEVIRMIDPAVRSLFRIIAISRNSTSLIPKLDTKFRFGDLIFVISQSEATASVNKYFGRGAIRNESVMIMGGSDIAVFVAKTLASTGKKVKIIDKDRQRCIDLSGILPDSVEIIHGDGRNSDILLDEGIRECDAFLALTGKDEGNILACVAARKFGVTRTFAEVENLEYIHLAEELGIDNVINRKLLTAGRIFKLTLSDRARFVKYMTGTNAEILEYTVSPSSPITRKALKDIDFPDNAIVGGVIRGNDAFIAVGDTRIREGDRAVIFAMPEAVKDIDKLLR